MLRIIRVYRSRRRYRRTYSAPRRTTYTPPTNATTTPKVAPKPAQPIPATTPFTPRKTRPIITEPLKRLPSATPPSEGERDWVKERLGR